MNDPFDIHREKLRKLLRQAREQAGLRQVDLASKINRPQSFVSKYESGERQIDIVELLMICRALRIPLAEFAAQFEESAGES